MARIGRQPECDADVYRNKPQVASQPVEYPTGSGFDTRETCQLPIDTV